MIVAYDTISVERIMVGAILVAYDATFTVIIMKGASLVAYDLCSQKEV